MENKNPAIVDPLSAQRTVLAEKGKLTEDLTGRDRLVSNVLFSWAAYSVFVIAGFIMPRMIDRRLGQETLGLWDFAWSLVSCFELVQAGIASSVNRYVAKYRILGDMSGMNRTISSASCMLGVAGLVVMGLTISVSLWLPQLFGARLGENVTEVQWVVFFLGASLFSRVSLGAFNGILTGCHRWSLHNINTSGWYAATVAAMITALWLGGQLRSLAVMIFLGETAAAVRRVMLARRVCPGLRLRLCLISWQTMKELIVFGGKTLIPSVSQLLLYQTTSILVTWYLGPASLALYARPQSLVRQVHALITKMAVVLTPTTSSLQSGGDVVAIRELLIKSARYSLYMALPMVLVLVVFGDVVMQFWMGPHYAKGLVPALLAVGFLAMMVQTPVRMVLVGLNAHGQAGVAELVASLCAIGMTFLVLGFFRWGLAGAAIALTVPLTIMNVVYLPLLTRRRIGLGTKEYFWSVTKTPVLHVLPFAICLVTARLLLHSRPMTGLACGGIVGGTILAAVYWLRVLPDRVKTRVRGLWKSATAAAI
jgi:O-antigen/teichoic acid export membrane protein